MDSFHSHAVFAEQLGLNFPLLSDWNREVTPLYPGFHPEVGGGLKLVGRRAVYVIDRDGTVIYRWVGEKPSDLPNPDEVLAALRARYGDGGATPS